MRTLRILIISWTIVILIGLFRIATAFILVVVLIVKCVHARFEVARPRHIVTTRRMLTRSVVILSISIWFAAIATGLSGVPIGVLIRSPVITSRMRVTITTCVVISVF